MPVIQLIGLPGSGKSSLAKRLVSHLNWSRSFRIGTYHKRFPATEAGDQAAWSSMLEEMAACGWNQFVFETTGLNPRWKEVMDSCGCENVLVLKLECKRAELLRRISLKSTDDQLHGDWFPPHRFRDKSHFVGEAFEEFSRLRADVLLDTTWATAEEVFDLVIRYLSARSASAQAVSAESASTHCIVHRNEKS
jgi:broad-specificity NMP kinase